MHKRNASETISSEASTKKSKTQSSPKKSQYFDNAGSSDDLAADDSEESPSAGDDTASEFGGKETPSEASSVEDPEDDSEDEAPRKKSTPKGGELWRPGVKTGLGPGKQVIIKKPKARAAGKTPYLDETIHPNTLLFLQDLKANNDRQWLKSKFLIVDVTQRK